MYLFTVFSKFYDKSLRLHNQVLDAWYTHSLFTWRWWIGVLLIVIPLALWIKFRNKESSDRLQYAGLLVAIISAHLDYIGTFFGLWKYDYDLHPAFSTYIPFSIFILPITVMFLIQTKPKTNLFIKALLFAIFSLIALPIVDWIGIYDPVKWNYLYSFVIQFFIYLLAHFISRKNKFKELIK